MKMQRTANISAMTVGLVASLLPMVLHAQAGGAPFAGTYAGIDAGPAWASSSYQTNSGCVPLAAGGVFCIVSPDPSASNGVAVANSGSGNFNIKRLNYDAHVGHDWNIKNYIVGGEAEFGGMNISQSMTSNGLFPFPFLGTTYSVYDAISTSWLATLRARAGVVVKQQFLLYATGGLAFTDLKLSSGYNDNAVAPGFPGGSGSASKSNFKTGWTLGGGGEWQLSDAYSLRLEYLYVKFGSINLAVPLSNTSAFTQTMQTSADLKNQILRIGLNYRF